MSQRSGQNIPTRPAIATVKTMTNSHELTRCEPERSTYGFGRRPKTKRRLSGWLSKIRMCRIFFPAAFVNDSRLVFLRKKIFLAGPRCRPATEKVRPKFSSSLPLVLTNCVRDAIHRSSRRSLFMAYTTAADLLAAMARRWDLMISRERRPQAPLLGDRRSLNGCSRGRARRSHQDRQ
jgi:hypothetical protein